MPESMDLEPIIAGCKNGEEKCFSRLVDLYGKRCYGYFYRMTGNRAISDDLLSELFLRIVEKISSFKDGSFEAWLFRVASNIFHDYLRHEQRQKKALEEHVSQLEQTEQENPHDSYGEQFDKLQAELSRLDADTQETIILRFYCELSFKEISSIRAEPVGTTLSRVHRGLKKLRDSMGQ